jgi:hypothetical protein
MQKKITHRSHQDTVAHERPLWKNDRYLLAQLLLKN